MQAAAQATYMKTEIFGACDVMALSLLVHWGLAKASGSQTLGISAEGAVPEESYPLEEVMCFVASSGRPGRKGEASQAYQAQLA